jgi:hypothetical protein
LQVRCNLDFSVASPGAAEIFPAATEIFLVVRRVATQIFKS